MILQMMIRFLNLEKREFPNLKVCHGQNRCIQYNGTWKLACIPILWLDQLLEAQEETLGGW